MQKFALAAAVLVSLASFSGTVSAAVTDEAQAAIAAQLPAGVTPATATLAQFAAAIAAAISANPSMEADIADTAAAAFSGGFGSTSTSTSSTSTRSASPNSGGSDGDGGRNDNFTPPS